jgi:hypothetical protein
MRQVLAGLGPGLGKRQPQLKIEICVKMSPGDTITARCNKNLTKDKIP